MTTVVIFAYLCFGLEVGIAIDPIGMFADANAIIPTLLIASNPLTLANPFGSHRGLLLPLTALMLQRKIESLRSRVLRRVGCAEEPLQWGAFEG